ncbi:Zeatin O-glucosyltransferase [Orobanche gracilis]
MTHCGWNSCIESISMGKPIIAWPMHSDQPRNAVLMTKVLRIGVQIKDWARRDEVISSDEIENALRRLMSSDEGNEMRRRAAALGDAVEKSLMEGGVSSKEMDSFITHIARRNP